jgi:hypothetical protein
MLEDPKADAYSLGYLLGMNCWVVVWNMFYDFPYIGKNHPN